MAATGGDVDSIRNHILDSAHHVIETHGLAAASTRAIAEAAGISVGTVYNYFDTRLQLIAHSMLRRVHTAAGPLDELRFRAGRDTVAENLMLFVQQATMILDELVPLIAAAFSDPDLHEVLRLEMTGHLEMSTHHGEAGHHELAGPFSRNPVESYLRVERDLGRVAQDADCRAAASLVVSLCHDHAFRRHFHGGSSAPSLPTEEIELIAHAVTTPRMPRSDSTGHAEQAG